MNPATSWVHIIIHFVLKNQAKPYNNSITKKLKIYLNQPIEDAHHLLQHLGIDNLQYLLHS